MDQLRYFRLLQKRLECLHRPTILCFSVVCCALKMAVSVYQTDNDNDNDNDLLVTPLNMAFQ